MNPFCISVRRCSAFLLGAVFSAPLAVFSEIPGQQLEFFEKEIRPILVEHCYRCHGGEEEKIKGGLVLTNREALRSGGDSGPALTAGKPDDSLLIEAIRYHNRDLQMPPKSPLPDAAVAALEKWVEMGAPDPREGEASVASAGGMSPEEGREFWSFQKPRAVDLAEFGAKENPIDFFIGAKLEEVGLKPAAAAGERTWLRRATFDLIGLPPSKEETNAFLKDNSSDARAAVIDRLLGSSAYGVRWGRHWLDVARYADSNGLDENLAFGNAWRYRDWVVDAFNEDMPYNQFVLEQMAGDLLEKPTRNQLVATGFLALGARVLAEKDEEKLDMDVIDELLDTTGKAFLGLTLGCARCHDHKFDPILQSDYYSLAAIFKNSKKFAGSKTGAIHHWYEHDFATEKETEEFDALDKEIKAAKAEATGFKNATITKLRGIARDKAGDYLTASAKIDRMTSLAKVAEVAAESDLHPRILYKCRSHLELNRDDPVFAPWWKYVETNDLAAMRKFYQGQFAEAIRLMDEAKKADPKAKTIDDETLEPFRAALFDNSGFLTVPAKAEHAFGEADLAGYHRLAEVARVLESGAPDRPAAMGIADVEEIVPELPVHIRGSHLNLGDPVPRAIPAVFSEDAEFPAEASGRLELAKWMSSGNNPLTARVIVNRVWRWHFGKGLVSSTENFGVLGDRPSHPELLDWLALWFVENDWSIKKLNRLIMTSDAYARASSPMNDAYASVDPSNRMLSFFPVRRLEAEAIRDSILAVSGRLDDSEGGKTIPLRNRQMVFNHTSKDHTSYDSVRRSLYLPIVRNNLYDWLQLFDFPDPTMPTGHRQSTVIAPQALLVMNAPLIVNSSAAFAARLKKSADTDEQRIHNAWLSAYNRPPTAPELASAADFLASGNNREENWQLLCHSIFASNEFLYLN